MRSGPRMLVVAVVALALVVATLLAMPAPTAMAANTVPFTPKFSTNANGAIVAVGNNLLTCAPASTQCTAARQGTATGGYNNNNQQLMVNLDADGDGSTKNSSMSRLALPAGATVLWAGLYWGATMTTNGDGTPANAGLIGRMSLRVPGAGTYQTVAASALPRDQFGPNTDDRYQPYQRFADVTAQVRAAGAGDYWGANVEAATGTERYAGWALTVVYSAPGLPLRNLTVFDGFASVGTSTGQSPSVTVPVSGFLTPRAGTVNTQLTMLAYDGDIDSSGDEVRLNSTQLATALSPGSNFFDSSNDLNGASVATRTPADRNMLGYDIKNLGASGALGNNVTSAQFVFRSSGEGYFPGMVGMAINLYAPDFTASSKTVVDLNGNSPARPGDTLQYTLNYINTGQDPAVQVVSEDVLPANTTYVPGSLTLTPTPGATPVPLTDAAGDDVGEITGRTVRVRLGQGASNAAGGTMDISGLGQRAAYTFRVTLDAAAGGTTVTNLANLSYRTGTTDIPSTYTTNPASVDVITQANLAIAKDMTPDPAAVGSEIIGTITVRNNGPNTAQNVTMRDPIIDGWTNDFMEVPAGVGCTVDTVINCTLGAVPAGASVVIRAHGQMAPGTTQPTLTNVAYASTDSYDPDLTDNVASDTISLIRVADLAITKTASPASAPAGSTITYTLSVRNNGASDAQDVVLNDTVDNQTQVALTNVTGTTGGLACAAPTGGALRCTAPTLAAGATATVTVQGVLAPGLASGVIVSNSATVTASTADLVSGNNRTTAQVTTTAPQADLRLTKTGPATAVAGSGISYTIVVTNWGPSNALATVVTDVVPVDITATSVTTDRGTCAIQTDTPTAGRQRVLCSLTGLPSSGSGTTGPGATATITVAGTVAAGTSATQIGNTASVQSITTDPAPDNNSGTTVSAVTRAFDLAVSKRANRTSLPAAAENDPRAVTYTITVTNNGPSSASGVVVADLVPTVLQLLSATPTSGGTCTAPQPTADTAHDGLTCTLSTPIPPGGSQTVVVSMQAVTNLVAAGDAVTETVTVSAPGETGPTSNNTATWTLEGSPLSDLELRKTAPATVTAGTVATYHFDITNHADPDSPIPAIAPTLVDTLPAGVTLIPSGAGSQTPSWCSASGQTVTCTMVRPDQNIDPNTTSSFDISVLVGAGVEAGSTLVNTAQVINDPDNPDPVPANNFSTATSTVVSQADPFVIGMTITTPVDSPTGPGSPRTVTFTLGNNGPSVARDVVFRNSIALDAAIDLATLPQDCSLDNGELVCTIDGDDLAPGDEVTIGFDIVLAGYVAPGTYGGATHVSSTTPDADDGNNDATASTVVTDARTSLQITKSAVDTIPNPNGDGHPAYVAGRTFAFQIQVSVPNTMGAGIADAQDVLLTDPMPAGFGATLVSTTQGTCEVTGNGAGISCALGTVAAWPATGQPVSVTVYGFVDVSAEGEQVTNTATATSATPSLTGGLTSVSASTIVDVVEQADLRLFKVADNTVVDPDGTPVFYAGGSAGFTLTAVNAGPSDVENTAVTDTLPVGLTLDATQSPGCSLVSGTPETGQVVSCAVGAIGVGSSVSIRLVAATSPDDGAPTPDDARGRPITNRATVSSGATDPDPTNNAASADALVERLADDAITGSPDTTTPAAGGQIVYTGYTINNGPSASWVNTGDTVFPPGFVPVSYDVPFNTCTWSPLPPADPATAPWQDVSYTLHCEPADPSGPFEPGVDTTSVVVLQIPGDTPTGTYHTRAEFRTTTAESTYDNNIAESDVYVQHVSNTRVVKTLVEPNPMLSGRPATWRLTATNDGPSIAQNLVVSDAVPPGMTFISAQIEGGAACPAPEADEDQLIVRCRVDQLGVGQTMSALVTFDVDPGATGDQLCNAALVGSGSLDPDASDNESQACGQAVAPPSADIAITVTPGDQTLTPGSRGEFTATVRNDGPGQGTSVVATFQIPPGLTDYSGVAIEWPDGRQRPADCVVGSLTCTIGDLAPGEQVVYRIVGTVVGDPGTSMTIVGTTAHGESDPVPANDRAEAAVTLAATPPAPGGEGTPPPGGEGTLALTGTDPLRLALAALLAIGFGGWPLAARRRSGRPWRDDDSAG